MSIQKTDTRQGNATMLGQVWQREKPLELAAHILTVTETGAESIFSVHLHIEQRSRLAKGLEFNAETNSTAPGAAGMLK
ncbi:hypothetical protein OSTOST_06727, partial [Ostertagia ostertagi]